MSDKNNAVDNFQKGLNTGIAELILLSVVQKSKEHLYGYQIAKIIEKENGEVPVIKLGTLYPFLRSLEKSGFLESRLDHSSAGPPRRYYQITEKGKATLQELIVSWNRTKLFVNNILAGNQDER